MVAAASRKVFGLEAPSISSQNGEVRVQGPNYTWEYSQADDTFRLRDFRKRLVVSGRLQPAVVVAPVQDPSQRHSVPGKVTGHRIEQDRVTIEYEKVNGEAHVTVAWRFDEHGIWLIPIIYDTPALEDVVSLYYFNDMSGTTR
jgi:hypothetical protein